MQKISLRDSETGEVFEFEGRFLVSKLIKMGRSGRYGKVIVAETAFNRTGRLEKGKFCYVVAHETQTGSFAITPLQDGWCVGRFFQDALQDHNHDLHDEAFELMRQASANDAGLLEWHDRMLVKFLKKRMLGRERAQIEREQAELAEKELQAEKLEMERLAEEHIQKQQEELEKGWQFQESRSYGPIQ